MAWAKSLPAAEHRGTYLLPVIHATYSRCRCCLQTELASVSTSFSLRNVREWTSWEISSGYLLQFLFICRRPHPWCAVPQRGQLSRWTCQKPRARANCSQASTLHIWAALNASSGANEPFLILNQSRFNIFPLKTKLLLLFSFYITTMFAKTCQFRIIT